MTIIMFYKMNSCCWWSIKGIVTPLTFSLYRWAASIEDYYFSGTVSSSRREKFN